MPDLPAGKSALTFKRRQFTGQNYLPSAAVRVGENYVLPLTTVRDLGVLIDSDVAMRSHVSRTAWVGKLRPARVLLCSL